MFKWLKSHSDKVLFVLGVVAFIGLFYSRALLSIATVAIGLIALLNLVEVGAGKILKTPFVILLLTFGVFLGLSYFYTDNTNAFLNELSFKWSFILLAIAFYYTPFTKKQVHALFLIFGFLAASVAIGTFINYLLNYEEINELISKSKPIPVITGYFHISFSFMLGFSVLALCWLIVLEKKRPFTLWLYILPIAINFILLHVIAARTGLVSLYAGLFAMLFFYYAVEKSKPWLSISAVLVLALLLVAAVSFVKPLHNRYENTMVDLRVYLNDENANWWSGAMRLHAIENSWQIFVENPVIGVGMADLNLEVEKMWDKRKTLLLPENRINPHNQFLNLLVVGGSIGFFLFVLILLFAFIPALKSGNWFMVAFLIMSVVGLNLESFLERQFGSCFLGIMLGLLFKSHFYRK